MTGCICDPFAAHIEVWLAELRHAAEVRWLLRKARAQGRAFVQDYLNAREVRPRRTRLVQDLNAALAARRAERKTA